jgi:uncharacterized protein YndB with AHSA1/START domain
MKTATELKHVYEVYIRTTPQKLWQAITDPEISRHYFYGGAQTSDWKPGSSYALYDPDDKVNMLDGKVLEADPPRKLVHTFHALQDEGVRSDRPSRVTWQIDQVGEVCKLTVIHDDFDGETATYKSVQSGWGPVLSGLKTLLETGKPLNVPMPN